MFSMNPIPKSQFGLSVWPNIKATIKETATTSTTCPFYRLEYEFIKPSRVITDCRLSKTEQNSEFQSKIFNFSLIDAQVTKLKKDKTLRIILRLLQLDKTSRKPAKFGIRCMVNVNNENIQVIQPLVDVTDSVLGRTQRENTVFITWYEEIAKVNCDFLITVGMMTKLSAADVISQIKMKPEIGSMLTRSLIIDVMGPVDKENIKLPNDCFPDEFITTSLVCPIGKQRMKIPCRSIACTHFRCFDATNFIEMNEIHPSWKCPVCNNLIDFDDLRVDGYFQQIIDSLPKNSRDEVEIDTMGNTKTVTENERDRGPKASVVVKSETASIQHEDLNVTIELN